MSSEISQANRISKFESELCELHEVNYQNASSEQSLIFFNGIPVTSLIYQTLIEDLIDAQIPQNIIRVDFPGTGQSHIHSPRTFHGSPHATQKWTGASGNPYRWSSLRQCLKKYFQAKISQKIRLNLVVHDIAGPVILPLLKEFENQIDKVVILNTVVRSKDFKPIFPLNLIRIPIIGLAASSLSYENFYLKNFKRDGVSREGYDHFIRNIYQDFKYRGGKIRLHALMRGFELSTQTDQIIDEGLHSSVEKLVIWAPGDPSLGYQFSYIQQSLPHAETHIINGAKHFLMIDHHLEISLHMIPFLFR